MSLIHIGNQPKPPECSACAFSPESYSFVPDWVPVQPKIAILLDMPYGEDFVQACPLSGGRGSFFEYQLLRPIGLGREDVLVSHVIRCSPRFKKFPTGKWRTQATEGCRALDDVGGRSRDRAGLRTWAPDRAIITLDIWSLLKNIAPILMIRAHLEKALRFAARGHKPIVCAGTVPMNLYAPHLHGGAKRWAGTWERL